MPRRCPPVRAASTSRVSAGQRADTTKQPSAAKFLLAASCSTSPAAGLGGRSVYEIEYLRSIGMKEAEHSKVPAAVAMSALEQCLWDIRGKVVGQPVYQLLGGRVQQRIRLYANINRSGRHLTRPQVQRRTSGGIPTSEGSLYAIGGQLATATRSYHSTEVFACRRIAIR